MISPGEVVTETNHDLANLYLNCPYGTKQVVAWEIWPSLVVKHYDFQPTELQPSRRQSENSVAGSKLIDRSFSSISCNPCSSEKAGNHGAINSYRNTNKVVIAVAWARGRADCEAEGSPWRGHYNARHQCHSQQTGR